jgi:O-antigen/teichoic acid export membrane protein
MIVILTFIINAAFNFSLGLLVAHFLGPEDFGRYALAQALGIMLNTALIDWVRNSASRFYSEKTRENAPEIRASLDLAFAVSSVAVCVICLILVAFDVRFELSATLAAMVPAVAVTNAMFDYHAALTRALFAERLFSRLVIAKNMLCLLLMVGGAWYFKSPLMVLAGMCVSLILAWASIRRAISDGGARFSLASTTWIRTFAIYALPIVISNSVYQLIPLYNRAAISNALGFAETGQYSLPYDLGIRLFATIGSAMDILLFQLAVREDEQSGREAARARLSLNMGLVGAIILPLGLGLWFVLPSIEATFVPLAFQGSFGRYLAVLVPGFVAFALTLYGLNAVFQIRRRTYPMILACCTAVLVNILLVAQLPPQAAGVDYARAQVVALISALMVTVAFIVVVMPVGPRIRDVLGIASGLLAMAGILLLLRSLPPGPVTLLLQVGLGALAYGAVAFASDVGKVRSFVRAGKPRSN